MAIFTRFTFAKCSFLNCSHIAFKMLFHDIGRGGYFGRDFVGCKHSFPKKKKKKKNDFKVVLSAYFVFRYINVPKTYLKRF